MGNDAVRTYRWFKRKITEIVKKPRTDTTPNLVFRFKINQTEVSGYIKTKDKNILNTAFDMVEELYLKVYNYVRKNNLNNESKIFVCNLEVEKIEWKPSYYITINNEVYAFDEEDSLD